MTAQTDDQTFPELDEFLTELLDRVDECAGTYVDIRTDSGNGLWLHTPAQIKAWIEEAHQAWRSGAYIEYRRDDA